MSNAAALLEFFKTNDRLRYVTPDSPDYTSLRTAYSLESILVPIGIARPQNARDVSDIVSFAVSKGVAITVRSGGFDLSGRCYAQDALCIDVRDINYVKVNDSNTAATIGGGASLGDVGRALSKLDLVTPLGSVPRIGYTGWATHGGYSMMEGNFGMGVDQILAAKIVNYEGKIVEADTQMLQVLRGGGGTLGVVVELTIKVYPLDKVLAGGLVFESSNLKNTIRNFFKHFAELENEGLPPPLSLTPLMINSHMGKVLSVLFVWSSADRDTGRKYLDRVKSFGTVIMDAVQESTQIQMMETTEKLVPMQACGKYTTMNLFKLTDDVVDVICDYVEQLPEDPAAGFVIYQSRRDAGKSAEASIFAARRPHFMLEFLGVASTFENAKASIAWAQAFKKAMQKTDPANIEPSVYISTIPPSETTMREIYGVHLHTLLEVKRKCDPQNVFRHAYPQIELN